MRRGLWFAAGAGAGAWGLVRAQRLAESLTADGLRDRLQGLRAGARVFRDEVAQGAAEKEAELRPRLGLAPPVTPSALDSAPSRPQIQASTTRQEDTDGHR